ncbi:hypothetical protein [Ruegeria sp.]|uniref:hypothetical protein n=1 Tax=Ruegeria sp. TaxID=1879320 RepID=UPI003AFFA07B
MRLSISAMFFALILPSVASAQVKLEDMYFGVFGGAVFGVDAEGENNALVTNQNATLDFDPSGNFIGGFVIGARVTSQVRTELELSFANSDVDGTRLRVLG